MAAAADGFAVGVEHHQLDVREAAVAQHVGELEAQPLDRDRGHGLAEMTAGVGEAGLDAEPAALPHIGGEVRVLQTLVDHAQAALERLGGLEQRRDVDLGLDPEQLREVERRQQGQRRFRLRDQEAHRRGRIDVFQHLRDDHEQALGRGALRQDRGEVDADRLHVAQQLGDRGEVGALAGRIVRLGLHVDQLAHGVVDLHRVQPHMGVRHAEAVVGELGAQDQQLAPLRRAGAQLQCPLDQLQQLAGFDQAQMAALVHALGEAPHLLGPGLGVGVAILEHLDLVVGFLDGERQAAFQQLHQVREIDAVFAARLLGAQLLDHFEILLPAARSAPAGA